MWTLTAPVDAFQLTARHLTAEQLARFQVAFREVFGRIDPKVEISPDEWLYHDIRGDRGHSAWLRTGMAETLLLIAERGANARLPSRDSPSRYADDVVRGLPGLDSDWRALASIRDHYARLMEAAPDPLLDSLEALLEAKPDQFPRMFTEGKSLFGGGGMHVGLLWGLETLAWDPDYLDRVALILARLASLDPGGRIANRPINSLRDIFMWWHPGTNATTEARLATIDRVVADYPDVGWKLLEGLLPHPGPWTSLSTARPLWRDPGDLPKESLSGPGQRRYLSAIADRTVDHVGTDPPRWRAVLGSLRLLGSAQSAKVLQRLKQVACEESPTVKAGLWHTLREFVYENRTFRDASWALTGDALDGLEELLPLMAPQDPVERNKWLFSDWLPYEPSGEGDTGKRTSRVTSLRQEAAREVLESQGERGLIALGAACGHSDFVATSAASVLADIAGSQSLVKQAICSGEAGLDFASQISRRAQERHGDAWRHWVRMEVQGGAWSPAVAASLLLWWPDSRSTWEEAALLGEQVEAEYWRRKPLFSIAGPQAEAQEYQIPKLIEAGRALEAFRLLALAGDAKDVPTNVLLKLFDAALDCLAGAKTPEEARTVLLRSHDIGDFLEQLRGRTDLSRDEVARREYRVLPLLGPACDRSLTLHEFMAEDAGFFVDVLCDVFVPASLDK